jgi:hypothetical protein
MSELRVATALAQDLARPLAMLAGLAADTAADGAGALDPDLLADLTALTEPERRVVQSLANSLLQNRGQ